VTKARQGLGGLALGFLTGAAIFRQMREHVQDVRWKSPSFGRCPWLLGFSRGIGVFLHPSVAGTEEHGLC